MAAEFHVGIIAQRNATPVQIDRGGSAVVDNRSRAKTTLALGMIGA
jgi:hypothetical protein